MRGRWIKRQARRLLLTPALVLCLSAFDVGVDDTPLADAAMEAQARALMKEIRCVVCQNQSIEDSNADLAKDWRQIVRERLAAGEEPDAIKTYLVDRYGDWVLLQPPFDGRTWLLWASPFLMMLILGAVLLRRNAARETAPLSAEEAAELSSLLRAERAEKTNPGSSAGSATRSSSGGKRR